MREDDVWRLPPTVRGEDARLGGRDARRADDGAGGAVRSSLSPAAKARLRRIVARVPEAMVKITGRARGGAVGLKAHLDYITRNAALTAETQDGTRITGRAALRALNDDWLLANQAEARGRPLPNAAQSVSVILSMPPGTPADRVEAAARSWARHELGQQRDWLMVRHDDTTHPHVHVSIRAVGPDGLRLAPGPADLQRWREGFARELRRLGVEAEATPRQARGAVRRSTKAAVEQMARKGEEPRVRKAERQAAERDARAAMSPERASSAAIPNGRPQGQQQDQRRHHQQEQPKPPPSPERPEWNRTISARQANIRDAYLAHAAELARGDADDRCLARDIERFVADMPVALTRRQATAVELRRVLERQGGRGTPASTASPAAEVLHGARPRDAEQPRLDLPNRPSLPRR